MNFSTRGVVQRFKAAIVRSFTQKDPEIYRNSTMEPASGIAVTSSNAMQLDAVWSCVRLIAETIATLPLNLYIRDGRGIKVADRHPLQFILHDMPNSATTAAVFWESVVAAMLLQGNAYIEKKYSGGRIASLLFLAPRRLQIVCDINGAKRFYYNEENGKQREIARSNVWQLQGFSLDGKDGVSVLTYGAQVFSNAIAADRQAGRTFRNGSMANVYYKVAAFLTPEQRQDFKDNVQESVEEGRMPILEGGIDVDALGIKPSDAQLLESRSYGVETICRWFRVPPSMVGHDGKTTSWGTGIEQQMLGFLTFTLTPWLVRIEQGIHAGLLTPAERSRYFAKFETDGLLRADSKATADFLGACIKSSIMTADEARGKLGLPPKGGNADKLLAQGAMVILDSITEQDAPSPTSPTSPALENALAHMRAFLKS